MDIETGFGSSLAGIGNAVSTIIQATTRQSAPAKRKFTRGWQKALEPSKYGNGVAGSPQHCGTRAMERRVAQMNWGTITETNGLYIQVAQPVAPKETTEDAAMRTLRSLRAAFGLADVRETITRAALAAKDTSVDYAAGATVMAERIIRHLKKAGEVSYSQVSRKWLWI